MPPLLKCNVMPLYHPFQCNAVCRSPSSPVFCKSHVHYYSCRLEILSYRFLSTPTPHISTVSLKHNTPLPLKNPSTPSGVRYFLGCATCNPTPLSATLSVMSLTSTRPAVLMLSMSAGARSSSRELQMRPMKLLSRAICTASLTEMVVRPELWIVCRPDGDWADSSAPSSLQRKTGSNTRVSVLLQGYRGLDLQLGCFQLITVQMSWLNEVKTMLRSVPSISPAPRSRNARACSNTTDKILSANSFMSCVGPSLSRSSSVLEGNSTCNSTWM
jgi:hypothetical protein